MNKVLKALQVILNIFTLCIPWLIKFIKTTKSFIKVLDLNKDGKVSMTEVKKLTAAVIANEAEIKIEWKK